MAGSVKRGRSVALRSVWVRFIPTPSHFVAIPSKRGWFCGDVATPSPAPSQTPSSTCVWLSPSAQTRSVKAILPLAQSILHVPHRVGHPKTLHHAPFGTLYRNILSTISPQTNTHRASRQGASRGAFTVVLTRGFGGQGEGHIGHDRHNGQGAKGGQIIHDKQQHISTTLSPRIPS